MNKEELKKANRKEKLDIISEVDNNNIQSDIDNVDGKLLKLTGQFAVKNLRCRIKALGGKVYYIAVIKNNSVTYISNYLTQSNIELVSTLKNARLFKSFEDANKYLEKHSIQFYTRIQSLELN